MSDTIPRLENYCRWWGAENEAELLDELLAIMPHRLPIPNTQHLQEVAERHPPTGRWTTYSDTSGKYVHSTVVAFENAADHGIMALAL